MHQNSIKSNQFYAIASVLGGYIIISSADGRGVDNLLTTGKYFMQNNRTPTETFGYLDVIESYGGRIKQIFQPDNQNKFYVRTKSGSLYDFMSWREI